MQVWQDAACEFTNGHVREWRDGRPDGALLHCSHGRRAIVRTRFDARRAARWRRRSIVVDRYQGRRLNSPNDVVVKRDGSRLVHRPALRHPVRPRGPRAPTASWGDCYVFRFDPATGALRIVSDCLEEPNGLAFSPDESVLYVSDTSAALRMRRRRPPPHRRLRCDGRPGPGQPARVRRRRRRAWPMDFASTCTASSTPAAPTACRCYHPDGTRIGRIPVPEKVGNLVFGGAAGQRALHLRQQLALPHRAEHARGHGLTMSRPRKPHRDAR
jgi:gluconolactonase